MTTMTTDYRTPLRPLVRPLVRPLGVLLVACWGLVNPVLAQDFKIYTPVYDLNAPQSSPRAGQRPQPEIVARSQSYFHAGKAYDYIDARESEQQVLIYEPTAQQFTILNIPRNMATTISFDRLEKMVREAETKAQTYVLRVREQNTEAVSRLDMIEFQLKPTFKEIYDTRQKTLTLRSDHMSYQVRCESLETNDRLDFYLKYCDWMARLNYVLHPQAPLPGPRLTLNGSLKKFHLMPTEVRLSSPIGAGINLKAEHQIEFQLEPVDRERIHQWQTLLSSDDVRFVTFDHFRDIQLAGQREQARR